MISTGYKQNTFLRRVQAAHAGRADRRDWPPYVDFLRKRQGTKLTTSSMILLIGVH